MKIWACAEPQTLFEGFRSGAWIRKMRECGIEGFLVLSVDVSREIPAEDVRQVKRLLDTEGFDMIGCGLALGHPEGLDTPLLYLPRGLAYPPGYRQPGGPLVQCGDTPADRRSPGEDGTAEAAGDR